jgi:hypothetical protein
MRIIIMDTEDKKTKVVQWDNPEDLSRFLQSLEKVQRAAQNWPSEPLEMPVDYISVDITKQTSPKKVDQSSYPSANPETQTNV